MGASRRRIDRRLSRGATALPPVAATDPGWLLPIQSTLFAAGLAVAVLAADQWVQLQPGIWFELLGASIVLLCGLSVILLLRHAWRRHRENLERRALLSALGAALAALLALFAVYVLVQKAELDALVGGADVSLTKPVIDSLPRPPGTRLLDEAPGPGGTESISQDFTTSDVNSVIPFYEKELPLKGWTEDQSTAKTPVLRFTRGDFVITIAVDTSSSGYSLSVDRLGLTPSPSPSGTVTASPGGTG